MMSEQACQSEPQTEKQKMQAEIDILTNGGIIEVAVRNPSVSEYMDHWEGRALKAEAELASLKAIQRDIEQRRERIARRLLP